MVEAIWGEHKTSHQIAEILNILSSKGEISLVTRVEPHKAKELEDLVDNIVFHRKARCVTLGDPLAENSLLGICF